MSELLIRYTNLQEISLVHLNKQKERPNAPQKWSIHGHTRFSPGTALSVQGEKSPAK